MTAMIMEVNIQDVIGDVEEDVMVVILLLEQQVRMKLNRNSSKEYFRSWRDDGGSGRFVSVSQVELGIGYNMDFSQLCINRFFFDIIFYCASIESNLISIHIVTFTIRTCIMQLIPLAFVSVSCVACH